MDDKKKKIIQLIKVKFSESGEQVALDYSKDHNREFREHLRREFEKIDAPQAFVDDSIQVLREVYNL